MKNIICGTMAILVAAFIAAAMPTEAEARIYNDTIRLHILAASDSNEDQQLKLSIRDKLLAKYGEILSVAECVADAEDRIKELIPKIETDCLKWIEDAGFDYGASVELCREWYQTREYGDFRLPAGEYLSLKIKLGQAEGKNWWCVMFPPLCLDTATEPESSKDNAQSYTKEETTLITNKKYNVKFKLLELFYGAFFKKG